MTFIDFIFAELRTPKTWSEKHLKSPLADDHSTSNIVNVPKNFTNLHHSIFNIFIDHCPVK